MYNGTIGSNFVNCACKATKESDIDIAVYLKGYDEKFVYNLWNELEDLLKRDVDLVVLNIANATVAWEALRGKKL
ncbi:nucleotidyltransferase domain-containing protein [Thermoanaerobacter wiegelii]|uniref:nucleotidyltransferase domain-containing protein n=1 Tax=Thermoanaerobacter wiegelii TaxID=46354 RepID=UPI003134616C